MTQTHRFSPFVAVALVLAVLSWFTPVASAGPVVVKMATLVPEGSSWHRILKESADRWGKISNGQVRVIIYPGGTQGDDPDVVRKMRLGTLNAGLLSAVGVAEIEKSVFAMGIPMGYDNYEELYYVLDKMRPKLEEAMLAKGFVVLNWADAGWVNFFSVKPIVMPDDMKSMKLFNWAGDSKSLEIWKTAGFNPVPLPSTELATALQTGLVNVFQSPPQLAVITRQYENAKNMLDIHWALLLGATVINKATWERIPPEIRTALLADSQETGRRLREEVRKSAEVDVEAMKKRGLNVINLDPKARAAWLATAEATYPRVRGDFVPAWAFDDAMKYRNEYRKLHPIAPVAAPAKK